MNSNFRKKFPILIMFNFSAFVGGTGLRVQCAAVQYNTNHHEEIFRKIQGRLVMN